MHKHQHWRERSGRHGQSLQLCPVPGCCKQISTMRVICTGHSRMLKSLMFRELVEARRKCEAGEMPFSKFKELLRQAFDLIAVAPLNPRPANARGGDDAHRA